jgi:hypothetical protein
MAEDVIAGSVDGVWRIGSPGDAGNRTLAAGAGALTVWRVKTIDGDVYAATDRGRVLVREAEGWRQWGGDHRRDSIARRAVDSAVQNPVPLVSEESEQVGVAVLTTDVVLLAETAFLLESQSLQHVHRRVVVLERASDDLVKSAVVEGMVETECGGTSRSAAMGSLASVSRLYRMRSPR